MKAVVSSVVIYILFAIALSVSAFSQHDSLSTVQIKPWHVGLGNGIFQHSYEEPGLMKEKGWSPFENLWLFLGYNDKKSMFAVEFEAAEATITYDGALQEIGSTEVIPVTVKKIKDTFTEIRAFYGISYRVRPVLFVTPYVGIGARFWNDDLSTWENGYRRESRYVYGPLGVQSRLQLKDRDFSLRLEYDVLLSGRQISHLSDLNGTKYLNYPFLYPNTEKHFDDVTNWQHRGYGLGAFIQTDDTKGVAVVAYIRYWNVATSDIAYFHYRIVETQAGQSPLVSEGDLPGFEPENHTIEFGIHTKLYLRF